MKKQFIILIFFITVNTGSNAQTIKFDTFDSVYIFCNYNNLISAVKRSEDKENKKFTLDSLASMKKMHPDTIQIDKNFQNEHFERETQWLVKHNKVSFFDKRNNKLVTHFSKTINGTKGQVIFYTYYDTDTNHKLFDVGIKSWQKF